MSVLETAIGWLAPPQCVNCGAEDHALCAGCSALLGEFGPRCWRCNRLSQGSGTCVACRRSGSPAHVYIVTDHDGLARDLLSAYKFGHQRAASRIIAKLMAQTLAKSRQDAISCVIVPIPTATSRVRQRGFDYTALLARRLSLELKTPYAPALRRLGQTRQLGAKREHRLAQLSGSFSVKDPKAIGGQNILLIDDVVTTGGTIIAAAQALRRAGAARVDALLFAKRL
jgi:ComF family protein